MSYHASSKGSEPTIFSLIDWSRSQGSWSQYAIRIFGRIRLNPETCSTSPRMALRRVDFPDPTLVDKCQLLKTVIRVFWEVRTVR